MKIYISLPITGHDIDEQKKLAAKVADEIRKLGYDPINPFEITTYGMTYGQCLGSDVSHIIDNADVVLMLPGWKWSLGCNLEYQCAKLFGKEVHFYRQEKMNGWYGSAQADAETYARATTHVRCQKLPDCIGCKKKYCDFKSRVEAYHKGLEDGIKVRPRPIFNLDTITEYPEE